MVLSGDSKAGKAHADNALRARDYSHAIVLYTTSIEACKELASEASELNFLARMYSNRSSAHHKLQHFPCALEDAIRCTETDPRFGKGWLRKGQALESMARYSDAAEAIHRAKQSQPGEKMFEASTVTSRA